MTSAPFVEVSTLTCPNCGHEFELSDALTGRIREHLKAELRQEAARREAEVKKKLEGFVLKIWLGSY